MDYDMRCRIADLAAELLDGGKDEAVLAELRWLLCTAESVDGVLDRLADAHTGGPLDLEPWPRGPRSSVAATYLEMFARRARFGWDYWGNESIDNAGIAA